MAGCLCATCRRSAFVRAGVSLHFNKALGNLVFTGHHFPGILFIVLGM